MSQFAHSSSNIEKARKLVEQIDSEVMDLIDFLQNEISMDRSKKYRPVSESKEILKGTKLDSLLRKAEDLRESASEHTLAKLSDWRQNLKSLWQEARKYANEGIKNVKNVAEETGDTLKRPFVGMEDVWHRVFDSAEWNDFFRRHPNLNPEDWKSYFLESNLDPQNWKYLITGDRPPLYWRYQATYGEPYKPLRTISRAAPQRLGEQALNQNLNPLFYIFFMAYLFLLIRRVSKARKSCAIHVGDGTTELMASGGAAETSLKSTIENDPKFEKVAELQTNLHCLRSFCAIVPASLITIMMLEINGASQLLCSSMYSLCFLSVWLYNERGIGKTRGLGLSNILGEAMILTLPLTLSALSAIQWMNRPYQLA